MTFDRETKRKLAENIELSSIRAYLLSQGWVETPDWREDKILFSTPDESADNYEEAILPKYDVHNRVAYILDAARNIARYEARTIDDVLAALQYADVDRMRCRLVSDKVENGAAPLGAIETFIKNVVNTFRAALKDVVQPEPYHKRLSSSEIDEMLKSASFGQTERGSFVVNIYMPLGSEDFPNLFRKSLEHLMRSLNRAVLSSGGSDAHRFIQENQNSDDMISANLLTAIENARIDDNADLEFSAEWSPKLRPVENVPDRVYIAKNHSACFKRWAMALAPQKNTSTSREFVGTVSKLNGAEFDAQNRRCGEVEITLFQDEKNLRVRTQLDADDYAAANESHMRNRYVVFNASLVHKGDKNLLEDVENFRIVSDQEDA